MANFKDGKPRQATKQDLTASREGVKNGKNFRCCLCGYKFQLGDTWRWIYAIGAKVKTDRGSFGLRNFLTCASCDGEDVIESWKKLHEEFYSNKFWNLRND